MGSSLSTDLAKLTHWGRAKHICVGKLIIIGSDNSLSPGRRQAIIWTSAGILLIWILGTNCSEILSEIHAFPCKKMHLKMSSAKWRPFVSASMCFNCMGPRTCPTCSTSHETATPFACRIIQNRGGGGRVHHSKRAITSLYSDLR